VGGDVYRQSVTLRPTGTKTLFALPGLFRFTPARPLGRVRYIQDDQTLATTELMTRPLEYEVVSHDASVAPAVTDARVDAITRRARYGAPPPANTEARYGIDPLIEQYARRPEVSGTDAQGRPLVAARPRNADTLEVDRDIAANIERHLRTTFSYTLDLSGDKRDPDKDPVVQFLYDWRKGHCEYFASAMVLMCQSLGIKARMVSGFKCDEYDANLGHYYVVRQSHAHAWVEVKTPAGWQTFDPTSGNDAGTRAGTSAWQKVKHFFGWLEYKWAEKVVAYDGDRRENLIATVDNTMVNTVLRSKVNPYALSKSIRRWWEHTTDRVGAWFRRGPSLESTAKAGGVALGAGGLAYVLIRRLRQRRAIRRRAAKIGLVGLPSTEQVRLARQLGFYEQLTTMLERRRIVRPRHLTPAEFGASLAYLPNEAYSTIRALTDVFYDIRFGTRELPQDEQRELEATVRDLEPVLDLAVPAKTR
jgi:transglutaminase-like putative cysteine protease